MRISLLTKRTLISILIIAPLGIASKFYHGPARFWVLHSSGDILYEIFWSMFLFLFYPRTSTYKLIGTIFLITVGIEFSQKLHYPILQWIRSSFVGRSLIGDTFSYSDISYYAIGCGIAFLWITILAYTSRRE